MSPHLRTRLKASACAAAFSIFAMPVAAQTLPDQTVPAPATAEPAQDTTADDGQLAEIIVTAQRRSESLQRVGVAVSAVTGDTLVNAGISEPANLSRVVPALAIQPTGGPGVSIYVRGVGAQATNAFAENAVAFNFNGVYIARPTAPVGTFFDLERVEVVKGPQGTLYGRNATGGAVNIIPRAPTLGEFNGELNLEYGNYDNKRGSAALNLPIGETVALRVAGQIVDRDPYLSDGYTDEVGQAARASLLFRPSSDFFATLVADYFHQGGKGVGSQLAPGAAFPTGQFAGYAAPALKDRIGGAEPRSISALTAFAGTRPGPPFCGTNFVLSGCVAPPAQDGYVDNHYYGVTAILEGNMGFGTLTVQPAYRKSETDFLSYFTGFRGKTDEDNDQMSLEVRLTSNSAQAFRYVIGGFYFNEKQLAQNFFSQGTLSTTRFNPRLTTDSKAVFGQATLDLSDRLRLIGGARYTKENKTQVTSIASGGLPFAVLPPLGAPFRGDLAFSKVTWKGGVEWDAGAQSLVYANVATGFKSGGFFVAAPPNNTFAPEQLTAYTIGSKNRFFGNRLQLNAEAFYWDYKDQQISFVGGISSGTSFSPGGVTVNAGNARMFGAELELVASVGAHGRLTSNVQYLDAKYNSLAFRAYSASGAPVRTGCAITGTSLANPGVNNQRFYDVDCAGKQTINSPKWTVDAGYEQTVPLGNYNLILGAQGRMQTSYYVQVDFLPEERQDAYFIGDASITLEPVGQNWSLTGYINNIGNETILAGATLRPVLDTPYVALRPPRTYGARMRYRF